MERPESNEPFTCHKKNIHVSVDNDKDLIDGKDVKEIYFNARADKSGECNALLLAVISEFIRKSPWQVSVDCLQHHSCEGQIAGKPNCCSYMAKRIKLVMEKKEPDKKEPEKKDK